MTEKRYWITDRDLNHYKVVEKDKEKEHFKYSYREEKFIPVNAYQMYMDCSMDDLKKVTDEETMKYFLDVGRKKYNRLKEN